MAFVSGVFAGQQRSTPAVCGARGSSFVGAAVAVRPAAVATAPVVAPHPMPVMPEIEAMVRILIPARLIWDSVVCLYVYCHVCVIRFVQKKQRLSSSVFLSRVKRSLLTTCQPRTSPD